MRPPLLPWGVQEQEAEEAPGAMDFTFPALSVYLLQGHGVFDIGRGCDADGCCWGVIRNHGDGAVRRSLGAKCAFSDMDEALLCIDRALAERGGARGEKVGLLKCAQVYPSGKYMKPLVPPTTFTIDLFSLQSGGAFKELPPHDDFNFQLPLNWRGSKPDFSFASAFPKIDAKLLQAERRRASSCELSR
jgi:hypothetical protein